MENELTDVLETENTVEQSVEENVEGIELTDTTSQEEKKEVKMYSEEELNAKVDEILSKKIARERRKIEREYESKYSDYMDIGNIVSKGLNASNIKDAKEKVQSFYEEQGVKFEKGFTDREMKILGKNDANEIIELGFDDMKEEADRLAEIGYDNLSIRDKEKFTVLANTLKFENDKQVLREMGVKEDVLNDKEFKEFSSQFNSNIPFKNIYELYKRTKPKKEINTIGSMKGITSKVEKDYYTDEELNKLTLDDLADDKVWEKVRKSMTK